MATRRHDNDLLFVMLAALMALLILVGIWISDWQMTVPEEHRQQMHYGPGGAQPDEC